MAQIYLEDISKIIKNKKDIEASLNLKIKINLKEGIVTFEGDAPTEYLAFQIFEAINLGFSVTTALSIKQEGNIFEKINIKNTTKRKDLSVIRGRIIGTHGKFLENLTSLTGCHIEMKDNVVGIIGKEEEVREASIALRRLISGSEHANIYAYLEKHNAIKTEQ